MNLVPQRRRGVTSSHLKTLLAALGLLMCLLATPTAFSSADITALLNIEEEVTAVAYAPDGRLAYSIRRIVKGRRVEEQRDDIFLIAAGTDKPRRIVDGQKLVRGNLPFSYSVQEIRWSPDGSKMAVQILAAVIPGKSLQEMNENFEKGITETFPMTILLDDQGKEIKIEGGDSAIPQAENAVWLADGATVAYLVEKEKKSLLYAMGTVRPAGGRGRAIFENSTFGAVAWDAGRNAAAAVERDPAMRFKPRLVILDIIKQTRRELGELDAFLGGLTISPSGTRVAYFRDYDTMEIRDVADPKKLARVKVAYGEYVWAPNEDSILMKRALERKKGDFYWIRVPAFATLPASGAPEPADPAVKSVLNGLGFRDFSLSADAKRIAVIEPGKRNLLVYLLE